jgi:hypothetical protein
MDIDSEGWLCKVTAADVQGIQDKIATAQKIAPGEELEKQITKERKQGAQQ